MPTNSRGQRVKTSHKKKQKAQADELRKPSTGGNMGGGAIGTMGGGAG